MTIAVTPRDVLDKYRVQIRALLAAHGVTEAGVFGSVARGEDTSGSDLDVVVAFGPGARGTLTDIADALGELTGLSLDVVDAERIFERARRTGIGYSILRDTVPL